MQERDNGFMTTSRGAVDYGPLGDHDSLRERLRHPGCAGRQSGSRFTARQWRQRCLGLLAVAALMAVAQPLRAACTIMGTVTDGASGDPVAHVDVYCWDMWTTTHENGDYEFRDLSAGTHKLKIPYVGYRGYVRPAPVKIAVPDGTVATVDFVLQRAPVNVAFDVLSPWGGPRGGRQEVTFRLRYHMSCNEPVSLAIEQAPGRLAPCHLQWGVPIAVRGPIVLDDLAAEQDAWRTLSSQVSILANSRQSVMRQWSHVFSALFAALERDWQKALNSISAFDAAHETWEVQVFLSRLRAEIQAKIGGPP